MFKNLTSALVKSELYNILTLNLAPQTRTLATNPEEIISKHSQFLKTLFLESVKSVQPSTLIKNKIKVTESHLSVGGRTFALQKPCYIVGFGKAVLGTAVELEKALCDGLQRAIVTVPKGIFEQYPNFKEFLRKTECIEGAVNNIPDEDAMDGARKIKELVETLGEDDLLIVLISGGGSALLPLPKPPISLQEKQNLIRSLSKSGANIHELNAIRKQLSVLKGGGLARLARPCPVVSLILSDVVGDPLDVIASGPTVSSLDDPREAIKILEKYNLYTTLPSSIKTVLDSSHQPFQNHSTLQDQSSNNTFNHVFNFVIGTNKIATKAAENLAIENGYQCAVISHKVEADVDVLAGHYSELAREILAGKSCKVMKILQELPFELEEDGVEKLMGFGFKKKMLLIFAGEPTVVVRGTGKGGRNQQLALSLSLQLNNWQEASPSGKSGNISFLSAGTDGIDGPTDAAGAVGYSGLVRECSGLDINPEPYLKNNDSYGFSSLFRDGECLVRIGHSGTNVMDLHFLLIDPED
ncbi:glycerate kinase [Sitophilus oryzae]|uniref:Glycerate kinase n=1 Tax=Sitophilus oryzae TaxID=7048 RepID=A0A6J2X2S8_SITOR|nr:glycerate kinase [Sitophilus oryzae]